MHSQSIDELALCDDPGVYHQCRLVCTSANKLHMVEGLPGLCQASSQHYDGFHCINEISLSML